MKNVRDNAEAIRLLGKVAKNRQLELDASEIRLRAERRIGELMASQRDAGLLNVGAAVEGIGKRGSEADPRYEAPITLAEAGIDKNLADPGYIFQPTERLYPPSVITMIPA